MSVVTPHATAAKSSAQRSWITNHPLIAFFVLAYLGAWLWQLPLLLGQTGLGLLPWNLPSRPFMLLAILSGPFMSAIVVTARTEGRDGLRHLWQRYTQWRVGLRWYLLALLFWPLQLLLVSSWALHQHPVRLFQHVAPLLLTVLAPGMLEILIMGQLWEETGWRGFALPRLQQQFSPVWSSIILGTLWIVWHLPAFFYAGGATEGARMTFTVVTFTQFFVLQLISGIMLSIIVTWMYNRTESILIIMLFRTMMNTANRPFFMLMPQETFLARVAPWGALLLMFLMLALLAGTRGRLGYKREAPAASRF
jgi:membrane protease YdiL (CAAX protease family)